MPEEVPLRKKLLPTVGRGLWYICGFILLLSLPTFSYLVPTLRSPAYEEEASRSSGFVSRGRAGDEGEGYPETGDRFVRSGTGGLFSRSGYLGRVRSSSMNRSRRVRSTRVTASQRGLDRVSRRTSDRPDTRGETTQVSKPIAEESPEAEVKQERLDELAQMEQAYQSTLNYLFPFQSQSYGAANPFLPALNGRGGGGTFSDSSGDQDANDDGDSGEGDGSDDTGGGSEGDGSSGSSDSDDQGEGGEEEPRPYDFLLVGDFGASGEERLHRAYQESSGTYVLEDGSKVSFLPTSGVVGVPLTTFLLSDDEMLLSADFNGDGTEDVIVGGWDYPFSFIRGYLRRGVVSSEPDFEAVLQFVRIRSMAVYDFESDGSYELAVIFSDNPNLVIYKIEDKGIRYSREMSVPVEPSVVVGTQDQGVFKTRYLQVFGKSLQRSIVFSSLFPGAYSFSGPSSFQSVRSIQLDPPDGSSQGERFTVLHYDDVNVVVEVRVDGLRFLTSFGYKRGYPKLAIGHSTDDGSRQFIFIPRGG